MTDDYFQQSPPPPPEGYVAARLNFVQAAEPNLKTTGTTHQGSTGTVYECTLGDDAALKMLKISRMEKGIPLKEWDGFSRLSGIPGIPKLFRVYRESQYSEMVVAILTEKIEGVSVREFLTQQPAQAYSILSKIFDMIENFNNLGLHMPTDWPKNENWKVTKAGEPYLVDLGEMQDPARTEADAVFWLGQNLSAYSDLLKEHVSKMGFFEKRRIGKRTNAAYTAYLDRHNRLNS